LASYWFDVQGKAVKPDPGAVSALADSQPPARLANYLLGRGAIESGDWATAARRFEREGFSFPKGGQRFLRRAMAIWLEHEAWDDVRKRAHDRRYDQVEDAALRLELAAHDRD